MQKTQSQPKRRSQVEIALAEDLTSDGLPEINTFASGGHAAAPPLPPALAAIAAGRDHILTGEFARAANRASQTIRKNYSQRGECFGIRPLKFGNRLLWPVTQIAALLNGETQSRAT